MRLKTNSLTAALAMRVQGAMETARSAMLPARLPWPAGSTIEGLGKGDAAMCRFCDGMFAATFPDGSQWGGDGGAGWDMSGCAIHWVAEIDAGTGDVTAVPHVTFKVTKGGTSAQMAAALGATPQHVATLGPLVPFFGDLEAAASAFATLGLEPPAQTYVLAADAADLRATFLNALSLR